MPTYTTSHQTHIYGPGDIRRLRPEVCLRISGPSHVLSLIHQPRDQWKNCPINLKQLPDWALRPLSALRQAEPAGDHLVSTQAHALRLRAEARGLVLTTQTLYLPYCRALHLSRLVVHPLSSPSCIVYCLLIVCTFCSYAQIHRNRARLGLRYTAIPEALGAFETAASRCTGLYRRKQRIE